MSVLTYNGVCLPYPMTTKFDQQVVYDESNTDWMCTKFDIQVQAMINVNYIDVIYPSYAADGNPDDAASIMNAIRILLLRPRRELSFKVNDVEMIPKKAGVSGTVDARNGPRPLSCQIKHLTDVSFMILYHIEAHYWENVVVSLPGLETLNRSGSPVLSNRWSELIEYDNRMIATKTREGKYILRSDNDKGKIVDEMRNSMAVVGLAPGFIRVSAKYKVDPSGLAMEYVIVDREVFKYPPEGAIEASGTYTESGVRTGTPMRLGEARVRLRGAYNTSQDKLLIKAHQIVMEKLRMRWAPGDDMPDFGQVWKQIQFSVIRVNMFDNEVEVIAQVKFNKTGQRRTLGIDAYADDGSLTYTPDSDDAGAGPPDYLSRGTSNILLQAAKYYDPSLADIAVSSRRPFTTVSTDSVAPGIQNNLNHGVDVGVAGVQPEV